MYARRRLYGGEQMTALVRMIDTRYEAKAQGKNGILSLLSNEVHIPQQNARLSCSENMLAE
jgi:hypothetical protein